MKKAYIYKVEFFKPINGKRSHYFTSVAAIYEVFSHEQIGCRVNNLWNVSVAKGDEYEGKNCTITKELLTSKRQKNKRDGRKYNI